MAPPCTVIALPASFLDQIERFWWFSYTIASVLSAGVVRMANRALLQYAKKMAPAAGLLLRTNRMPRPAPHPRHTLHTNAPPAQLKCQFSPKPHTCLTHNINMLHTHIQPFLSATFSTNTQTVPKMSLPTQNNTLFFHHFFGTKPAIFSKKSLHNRSNTSSMPD